MDRRRPLRVLHCPTVTAGNPLALARAERELGLDSRALAYESNRFAFEADGILFAPGDGKVRRECKRWGLLWRALREFDIVHFNFGSSIFEAPAPEANSSRRVSASAARRALVQSYRRLVWLRDLPLIKRAGKGIVVTYQGDDARQRDYCLAHFDVCIARHVDEDYYPPGSDAMKRRAIAAFDRYADRIYALNPDLLHVLPSRARFLPYANVDLSHWRPLPSAKPAAAPPLVLHAPSHRGAKGTRFLLGAVERLRRDGIAFDFELVEGLPHGETRPHYAKADLLVDQLLGGWYGGLAVELMAMAKPVIAYIREQDLAHIPAAMREDLPIINATPVTIYDVLKTWLTERRHELPERGRRGRSYVERWHDPAQIARELAQSYSEIGSPPGKFREFERVG